MQDSDNMQIYALLTKCEVLKMAEYKCICQVYLLCILWTKTNRSLQLKIS